MPNPLSEYKLAYIVAEMIPQKRIVHTDRKKDCSLTLYNKSLHPQRHVGKASLFILWFIKIPFISKKAGR
jgi:hypothetical protein